MRRLRAGRVAGTMIIVPLVCCVTAPGLGAGNPPSSATTPAPPSTPMKSVVLTMRAAPELGRFAVGVPRGPAVVVSRLRARARSSQRQILLRLSQLRRAGEVESFKSLWISNTVAVTASRGVIASLAARSDVASVRPDAIVISLTADPTPNQVTIGSPTVWAQGHTGQGVVVATLDTGVDPADAQLASTWRGGTNSWFDPYGQHASPFDASGHGTGVLGVLVGGDDTGSAVGTAPGASWISARVFDDAGGATVSGIHSAFQWLLDPDGDPTTADSPQVVNASWAIGTAPSCDLVFQPDVQALRAAGIPTVFPAGNTGPGGASSLSPGNYPESLSVGAVNGSDVIRSDSGRGPSACGGRRRVFPDLVAPGTSIPTLDRYGLTQTMSGTSAAAPHVAGALAVLLGAHPGLSPQQQADLVTATAVDLGDPGPDDTYGAGRVDVAAAYAALPPPPTDRLVFSTAGPTPVPGLPTGDDADLYGWDGADFGRRFDARAAGLDVQADIDGLDVLGDDHFLASFDQDTWLPGLGPVQDEDIVERLNATWSVFFDGTGKGLTAAGADLDAIDVQGGLLYFSTRGDVRLPGVGGRADDADVYVWDGSRFDRVWQATAHGVPRGANVDGLQWGGPGAVEVSFANERVLLPGVGRVDDEDLAHEVSGTWSIGFDGTAYGLGSSDGLDIDAFDRL